MVKETSTKSNQEDIIEVEEIKDWNNIHLNFTSELQKEWEEKGFNYEQTKEWIDIGVKLDDYDFCAWLRDKVKIDTLEVLNNSEVDLREQYQKYLNNLTQLVQKQRELQIVNSELQSLYLSHEYLNQSKFKRLINIGKKGKIKKKIIDYISQVEELTSEIEELKEQIGISKKQELVTYARTKEVNSQKWLDRNYLDKEVYIGSIYINQQLEGVLNCSKYKELKKIYISSSVDGSKFEIKKGFYKNFRGFREEINETEIISCIPAQTYLDQNYPKNGTCQIKDEYSHLKNFGKTRGEIKWLSIHFKCLEGNLDLSDFKNLKEINCWNNQLTTLNLSNLRQLERLGSSNNYLTQIIYPINPKKITELDISNNNFSLSDLTIFSKLRNLKTLKIGNWNKNRINQSIYNRFQGSLEPLKDLNKLEKLDISNTDADSGWEYLPNSLEKVCYDTELRSDCKLALAKEELEKELWKDIHKDFISKEEYDTEYNNLLKKEWLENGFSKEECQGWINIGFKPDEAKYAVEWVKQGFNKEKTKKFLEEWNKDIELIRLWDGAFINWFLNFKKLDLAWAKENEEEFKYLRGQYPYFGTCEECNQPNSGSGSSGFGWCQSCSAKHFQDEFDNWTSGNTQIDNFILKCQLEITSSWNVLEWIPYKKFRNIEPIAQGGFGKVEKAEWEGGSISKWDNKKEEWGRFVYYNEDHITVALKTLANSQNLNQEFLKELMLYKMFKSEVNSIVSCYGISKDEEDNYIIVMKYMREGNLRDYLRKNRDLKFYDDQYERGKFTLLNQIIRGLKDIHCKGLVHKDFHSGNIIVEERNHLYNREIVYYITDLGLSKPADEKDNNQVYGIMPYMAPEVLRGHPYTQKSDIYSLGMVMYEVVTGLVPFDGESHDIKLALKICEGERPKFPAQVKYPQLLKDLIGRCWDANPNNRPMAKEINGIVGEWWFVEVTSLEKLNLRKDTEFYHQYEESEKHNKTLLDEIKYPTYQSPTGVIWHSKPINSKKINKLLEDSEEIIVNSEKQILLESEEIAPIEIKEEQLQSHQEVTPK